MESGTTAPGVVFLIVFRHGRRIIGLTVACCLLAIAYNGIAGAAFTARTRMLVIAADASGPPRAGTPAAAGAEGAALIGTDHGQAARYEAEIMHDPSLMARMLPRLGRRLAESENGPGAQLRALAANAFRAAVATLDLPGFPARPKAAPGAPMAPALERRLERAFSAASVGDTDVVALGFTWDDPDFAAFALNSITDDLVGVATTGAAARQSLRLSQRRVQDAEAQERALAPAPDEADPATLESEKDRVAARMEAASGVAQGLRVDRDLAAGKLDTVERAYQGGGWVDSAEAPETASGTKHLDDDFVALLGAREKLLAQHVAPDGARVHDIDAQITRAREAKYTQVKAYFTDRLRALDARDARLEHDREADQTLQRDLDDRLVTLLARRQNRVAAAARSLDERRRLDEETLSANAAMRGLPAIQVLSAASPPDAPDAPSPGSIVAAASLAGFLLACARAIAAERGRRTLEFPRDVTRLLGVPVLASVPELR